MIDTVRKTCKTIISFWYSSQLTAKTQNMEDAEGVEQEMSQT